VVSSKRPRKCIAICALRTAGDGVKVCSGPLAALGHVGALMPRRLPFGHRPASSDPTVLCNTNVWRQGEGWCRTSLLHRSRGPYSPQSPHRLDSGRSCSRNRSAQPHKQQRLGPERHSSRYHLLASTLKWSKPGAVDGPNRMAIVKVHGPSGRRVDPLVVYHSGDPPSSALSRLEQERPLSSRCGLCGL
jgi:hypothetical protein